MQILCINLSAADCCLLSQKNILSHINTVMPALYQHHFNNEARY
jgi:hypothetical protein